MVKWKKNFNNKKVSKGITNNIKKCGFCGKNNHNEDKCFLKQKTKALLIGHNRKEEFVASIEEGNFVVDQTNILCLCLVTLVLEDFLALH